MRNISSNVRVKLYLNHCSHRVYARVNKIMLDRLVNKVWAELGTGEDEYINDHPVERVMRIIEDAIRSGNLKENYEIS